MHSRFILIYSTVIGIYTIIQYYLGDKHSFLVSILALGVLQVSWLLLKANKLTLSANALGIGFYLIALYYLIFMGNIITPYLIYFSLPLIMAILLFNSIVKYFYLSLSIFMFFVSNHYVGNNAFDNHQLLIGLIPTFLILLRFHNRIISAHQKKRALIQELKGSNEEQLLFSQMMSHDLKAPITNIKAMSGLLLKHFPNEETVENELTQMIVNSADNLHEVVHNVLQISKVRANNYVNKETDLRGIIDEVMDNLSFEINGTQTVVHIDLEIETIKSSEEGLKIILYNLISNAIKYQPKTVTHKPEIKIRTRKEGTHCNISVSDNGIGIHDSFKTQLFEPFKKYHKNSDYKGTGLGLSICKKLATKLNGTIIIEDTQELGGSTFILQLPCPNV